METYFQYKYLGQKLKENYQNICIHAAPFKILLFYAIYACIYLQSLTGYLLKFQIIG